MITPILTRHYGPTVGPLGFPMLDRQAFALEAILKALPKDDAFTYRKTLVAEKASEVLPGEVDTRTRFSRNIELNIPLCSSAMDTVTEASLAIALAQQGGIGVIHKNFSV